MRRIFLIVAAVVFFLGLIFLSISLIPQRSQSESNNSSHILGSEDARVHIVGYFDLEAPESREAWEKIFRLRGQYGDRLSIEFRHYPITAVHPHAMSAAMALEAAGEQGKFWEFIDILWNQQDVWHAVSDPKTLFTQYAEQVGIKESARFRDDTEQQRLKVRILSDLDDAYTQGVSWGTPFLVNGNPTSIDVIQLAVERVISKPQ
jgi:protein-disulfide isomerase